MWSSGMGTDGRDARPIKNIPRGQMVTLGITLGVH
jgi:hypothetical protein